MIEGRVFFGAPNDEFQYRERRSLHYMHVDVFTMVKILIERYLSPSFKGVSVLSLIR